MGLSDQEPDLTIPASPRAKLWQRDEVERGGRSVGAALALELGDLAKLLGRNEAAVLALAQIADPKISDLLTSVGTLGGKLELGVVFGARRYPIGLNLPSPDDEECGPETDVTPTTIEVCERRSR